MATKQAKTPKRLRAGIIPYTTDDDGELVVLFGKELYGKWSALAGTVEPTEDISEAAVREFVEEAMGLFREEDLLTYLDESQKVVTDDAKATSHYYLVHFEWDPNLPAYFSNVTRFFLRCTGNQKNKWGVPIIGTCTDGLFEKSELAWFRISDLGKMSTDVLKETFGISAAKLVRLLLKVDWTSPDGTTLV